MKLNFIMATEPISCSILDLRTGRTSGRFKARTTFRVSKMLATQALRVCIFARAPAGITVQIGFAPRLWLLRELSRYGPRPDGLRAGQKCCCASMGAEPR